MFCSCHRHSGMKIRMLNRSGSGADATTITGWTYRSMTAYLKRAGPIKYSGMS